MRDGAKLRILFVTQYFWPENMRINDLVADFVRNGHEVTVLTGKPNYPEGRIFREFSLEPEKFSNYSGAAVVRVPLIPRGKSSITLALNYFSFLASASLLGSYKLRHKEFDSVFVYAVSPILAAIPAIVIGRLKKAAVFVWVLDLWPEVLSALGVVKNRWILGAVGKVVSWIYNRTDYILVQSRAFVDSIRQYRTKDIRDDRLIYFPSWAEDIFLEPVTAKSDLLEPAVGVFTLLFAGNLGESQDLPTVLDAVEALAGEVSVRCVLVGDGRMSEWLREQVRIRKLHNVILLGRHPVEAMPSLFASADALLFSLKANDVFKKTIPAKVQAYLAAGRPIVAMIDGEAAKIVGEAGAGYACSAGDARSLTHIVRTMAAMPVQDRERMGKMGREYYMKNFSKPHLFEYLESLFHGAKSAREGSDG